MTTLNLAFDVIQLVTLVVLSTANGLIAYFVYKLQKDRNTPKLALYVDEIDVVNEIDLVNEDRVYDALYVQNVGLVPALNVQVVVDIEKLREGRPVTSRFHERYDAYHDSIVSLNPKEHRLYELPWAKESTLIYTAIASCSNGSEDSMHFAVGLDPAALILVTSDGGRKRAVKKLKSRLSSKGRAFWNARGFMGLTSMKDHDELFGDRAVVAHDPP